MTGRADRADRASEVSEGTQLLFADLHNHSWLSDAAGDPRTMFGQLRAAGLDVAALTDHSSIPADLLGNLPADAYPDAAAYRLAAIAPASIDADAWRLTGELADAADVPGEFTAIRGFEWTESWLGHSNVWFSADYLPMRTPGRMDGLHRWLQRHERAALFGYNHPGREAGRFGDFRYEPALGERMVSLEMYNRRFDQLFEGWAQGAISPLVQCLDAGWRPGLTGVSDEHERRYGVTGKGRSGLWAPSHDRAGVREALLARRTYATREAGLVLDATLDGVRMGSGDVLPGPAELAVQLGGGGYDGRDLELQVLGSGPGGAVAVHAQGPAVGGRVSRASIEVPSTARWLVLRVAEPGGRNFTPGPSGHPANAYGVAYASPWWVAR